MNTAYERFLVSRNHYDGQVCNAPNESELLAACVRRCITVNGAPRTAGDLYTLADMIAVRGIDDEPTIANAKKPVNAKGKIFLTLAEYLPVIYFWIGIGAGYLIWGRGL